MLLLPRNISKVYKSEGKRNRKFLRRKKLWGVGEPARHFTRARLMFPWYYFTLYQHTFFLFDFAWIISIWKMLFLRHWNEYMSRTWLKHSDCTIRRRSEVKTASARFLQTAFLGLSAWWRAGGWRCSASASALCRPLEVRWSTKAAKAALLDSQGSATGQSTKAALLDSRRGTAAVWSCPSSSAPRPKMRPGPRLSRRPHRGAQGGIPSPDRASELDRLLDCPLAQLPPSRPLGCAGGECARRPLWPLLQRADVGSSQPNSPTVQDPPSHHGRRDA